MRKLAWEELRKNIVMDGVTMIDERTGEVKLIPEEAFSSWILKLIPHTGMINFKPSFIIFMDHKITCRMVEEIHILNGIGTLGTWNVCSFSQKIFFAFFSSLFKYFFPLFFRNLFCLCLGLVPNISLELVIFFHLLQCFVKFRRRDIFVLHWNDIGYAVWLGLGKQLNGIVFFFCFKLSLDGNCKGKK